MQIRLGTVHFDRMVAVFKNEETPIKRTETNVRERPDAEARHENNSHLANKNENKMGLIVAKNF